MAGKHRNNRSCAVTACDRKVNSNDYCSVHLRRLQKHGNLDILNPVKRVKRTPKQIIEDYSMPVPESGCWLWVGGISGVGYPIVNVEGKSRSAHRLSYEIYKGEIPDGMYLCHKCDIRSCVNPEHLFVGTARDNVLDMYNKGRNNTPRGENAKRAKLTAEQVLEIRELDETHRKIAAKFGISKANVTAIKTKRSWAHLP